MLDDLEFNKPVLQKEMRKISLKRNLSDFLVTINDERLRHQDIRPPDKFYIWIDAICIDQDNASGEAVQIPLMGEIYSNTSQVIIWLANIRGT